MNIIICTIAVSALVLALMKKGKRGVKEEEELEKHEGEGLLETSGVKHDGLQLGEAMTLCLWFVQ